MQPSTERRLTGRIARLRPDRVTLPLAALAVLSAGLILAGGANYGVGVTPDSLAHFQNAETFAAAMREFTFRAGYLHPEYPPLFPLALAFLNLAGLEPPDASGYLNAAAFGLMFFVCAAWLQRRAQSPIVVAWAAAAFFVAPPLMHVATWAYAGPLFILFAMLALFSLNAFLGSRARSMLLLAALFAALAFLTRYVGAALAATGFLLLLLHGHTAFRERIKNAVVYGFAAVAPVGLWLLRNFIETGTFTEQGAYAPVNSFVRNLWALGDRMQEALFGWSGLGSAFIGNSRSAALLLAGAAGGLTAIALLSAVCLPLRNERARSVAARIRAHPHALPFAVFAAFVFVYIALLLAGVSVQGVESVSLRYFAPIWPPILLMTALALDALLGRRRANAAEQERNAGLRRLWNAKTGIAALMAALVVWLLPQAALYADQFRLRLTQPEGIDRRSWTSSESIEAVRMSAKPIRIGTNNAIIAAYLSGIPDPYYYIPCSVPRHVQAWVAQARERGEDAYFIWIDGISYPRGCDTDLADVRAIAHLEIVDRFPNGAMFRATEAVEGRMDANRSAYAYASLSEPVIRSAFDVHLRDGVLTYIRESCGPADAQAKFFLHVIPVNESDLPYARRRYGFDNRDFVFDTHGSRFDGKCLTTAVLPDYPIARVRTGQFVRGEGRLWEGEFRPSQSAPN